MNALELTCHLTSVGVVTAVLRPLFLGYRTKLDRSHMQRQCEEHLVLIDLLKRGERVEASHFLREHLKLSTVSYRDGVLG
ncbi:hypothetical protein LP417_25055 [Polaromonas sp. P1-6]|nr:hypothetical protein LP417_25055 [Polaromonas sp. P1-6]